MMRTFDWLQLWINVGTICSLVSIVIWQRMTGVVIRRLLKQDLEERKRSAALTMAWNSVWGKMKGDCECTSIQAKDPNRHFKGCPKRKEEYRAPTLTPIKIEHHVSQAASKWWKVGDWFQRFEETRANPNGYTRAEIDAFWDFIVKLREEE